jgi:hypothetical protein
LRKRVDKKLGTNPALGLTCLFDRFRSLDDFFALAVPYVIRALVDSDLDYFLAVRALDFSFVNSDLDWFLAVLALDWFLTVRAIDCSFVVSVRRLVLSLVLQKRHSLGRKVDAGITTTENTKQNILLHPLIVFLDDCGEDRRCGSR